jgi:hypothetical protein
MADSWVKKTIRQLTHSKALESSEMKLGNCAVTPQAVWPTVKSFVKRDGPKAPSAIHGHLGTKCQPTEKANTIADCLENNFTPHDLYDGNHKWWLETSVQALLEVVDDTPLEKVRPCDMQTLKSELLGVWTLYIVRYTLNLPFLDI